MDGKYYWLKLKRDFFKRHDIRIIESMPNGKDYILFYLKLLCESVDHDGNLRFSEQIPYNEDMLATITNTNVDIVRSAIKIFAQLGMMEIMDDGTYYMHEVEKMIGSAADNDNANRQRRFRERQKQLALEDSVTKCNASITDGITKDNESKRKSKSKEKDKDNRSAHADYQSEFEQAWSLYPKKQGKKRAFEAYVRARKKGTTSEAVINGINAYLAYIKRRKVDEQFIKQGATFFFQEAWADEWTPSYDVTNSARDEKDILDGIL